MRVKVLSMAKSGSGCGEGGWVRFPSSALCLTETIFLLKG